MRHNIPPRSLSSLLVQVEELPPFALLLPLVHQSFRLQFDLQPFLFGLEVHPQLYPSFRLQILLFSRMARTSFRPVSLYVIIYQYDCNKNLLG